MIILDTDQSHPLNHFRRCGNVWHCGKILLLRSYFLISTAKAGCLDKKRGCRRRQLVYFLSPRSEEA